MQVHQESFKSYLQTVKEQSAIRYCNVYRDDAGKLHYSTEEFVLGQEGLFNFKQCLEDAFRLCVVGDWSYVSTMSDGVNITQRMLDNLGALSNAANILTQFDYEPEHYTVENIEEAAREIVSGALPKHGMSEGRAA